jgi:hypothetical protein
MFHKALSQIFLASKRDVDEYLFRKNLEGDESYLMKKQLMIFCFEGKKSQELDEATKVKSEEICKSYIFDYLTYRVKNESICLTSTQLNQSECIADLILEFVSKGLSDWFTVTYNPVAGFFIIADCKKLIDLPSLMGIKLDRSFDVFAFLAYFFGVRFIPAESMGIEGKSHCSLLRVSFSCDMQFIVIGLFSLFLGINHFIQSPTVPNFSENLLLQEA